MGSLGDFVLILGRGWLVADGPAFHRVVLNECLGSCVIWRNDSIQDML